MIETTQYTTKALTLPPFVENDRPLISQKGRSPGTSVSNLYILDFAQTTA